MPIDIKILQSEEYKEKYQEYKSKVNIEKLTDFLENIETNKKYYRTAIHKNKRYKKTVTEDTSIVKQINSFINRITDMNYEKLSEQILSLITKEYMLSYIIENLIEKSILHHIYTHLYVDILGKIPYESKHLIILKQCNKYHKEFFSSVTNPDDSSSYEKLCSKNKNIDNIIGYSILIAHLEKENIVQDYIDRVLQPFMKTLSESTDEEVFKILVSLEKIFQIRFDGIPDTYQEILLRLKGNTKSSKIRFKIMDILGL